MTPFAEIWERAAARHGGDAALEAQLGTPATADAVAAIPDDRWLSRMSSIIFSTGLSWQMVERKWPAFEDAFEGFAVARNAMMSDDDLDAHLKNTAIIRHAAKIRSVRDNAILLQELAAEHGSAGACFASWPAEDYAGLLQLLKDRGSRLGGTTGSYALRSLGRDGWVLSRDVVAALQEAGVIDTAPTSKRALAAIQAAFTAWSAESGRPFTQISQVLGRSTGPRHHAEDTP